MNTLTKKFLLFLFVVALLYAAVWGGYRWLEGRVAAFLGPSPARPGAGAETAARPVSDAEAVKTILARNIFAASLDGPPPVDFNLNDLAANAGPVELLGTVTGSGGAARAIIRSGPEGKERLYRIGERVQGAEITAIERGRVELAGASGRETLTIRARANDGNPPPADRIEASESAANIAPAPQTGQPAYYRSVPQSLPGRRVNTKSTPPPPAEVNAGGVPIRTGAAALRPPVTPENWEPDEP